MTPEYVNRFISRSNRNLLTWCLVGIAALVIGGVLGTNYLRNFFGGPFTVSEDQILKAQSLNDMSQQFITVTGDDDLFDTGYQYVSTSSGGKDTVESYYQALVLGDKLLLVKTDSLLKGDTATGGLVDMPGDVRTEVINDIEKDHPRLRDTFLPFMLDTGNYRIPGFIGLGIAAVILILTVIGLSRWITRRGDPLKHPIMKALSRFGDPQSIVQQIEMELVGDPVKVGGLRFTKSWMLQEMTSNLNATRFNDVVWAYKRITQHRTNGIPTGKTYAALIYDRYGKLITINGKEKVVDETLNEILSRAPGTVAGYSADILKMWKSDRARFTAAVDQKRRELTAR